MREAPAFWRESLNSSPIRLFSALRDSDFAHGRNFVVRHSPLFVRFSFSCNSRCQPRLPILRQCPIERLSEISFLYLVLRSVSRTRPLYLSSRDRISWREKKLGVKIKKKILSRHLFLKRRTIIESRCLPTSGFEEDLPRNCNWKLKEDSVYHDRTKFRNNTKRSLYFFLARESLARSQRWSTRFEIPLRCSCIIDRYSMTRLDKRLEVRPSGIFTTSQRVTSFPTITERNRSGKLKFRDKKLSTIPLVRAFHFRLRLLPSVRNIIRVICNSAFARFSHYSNFIPREEHRVWSKILPSYSFPLAFSISKIKNFGNSSLTNENILRRRRGKLITDRTTSGEGTVINRVRNSSLIT